MKGSKWRQMLKGAIAITPLSFAVIPWGILAGSIAMNSGFDIFQGQALSAIVFAGAAQLALMGMIKAGAGLVTIILTTSIITARHLLYGLAMRDRLAPLPLYWRLILGFLLTDELFAVCGNQSPERFSRWYAFGAGFSFYLCWNITSLVGIVAGNTILNLEQLGLDFAIAATFIALVVPSVNRFSVLVSVVTAGGLSVWFSLLHIESGLLIASLVGMTAGYFTEQCCSSENKSSGDKPSNEEATQ